jgi:hypothetical protein
MTRDAVVGRCWVCHQAVFTRNAVYVVDPAVIHKESGKQVRRVVHRGTCRDKVEVMFVGKVMPA